MLATAKSLAKDKPENVWLRLRMMAAYPFPAETKTLAWPTGRCVWARSGNEKIHGPNGELTGLRGFSRRSD